MKKIALSFLVLIALSGCDFTPPKPYLETKDDNGCEIWNYGKLKYVVCPFRVNNTTTDQVVKNGKFSHHESVKTVGDDQCNLKQ